MYQGLQLKSQKIKHLKVITKQLSISAGPPQFPLQQKKSCSLLMHSGISNWQIYCWQCNGECSERAFRKPWPGATKRDLGWKSWVLCNSTKTPIKLTYSLTTERRQYGFTISALSPNCLVWNTNTALFCSFSGQITLHMLLSSEVHVCTLSGCSDSPPWCGWGCLSSTWSWSRGCGWNASSLESCSLDEDTKDDMFSLPYLYSKSID